jgi:hypothetical protein
MFYFHLANRGSSRVVRASGCQCQSRNSPEFDPSILRHSGILGVEDEAALNNVLVHKKEKIQKIRL